ncbi:MAG: 50S ribosomal protein L32 [Thermoguttaceae bacterium]
MAVPKRKTSKARTGSRRAHDSIKPVQTVACPDCHKMIKPHVVCPNCGYYMRREVVSQDMER